MTINRTIVKASTIINKSELYTGITQKRKNNEGTKDKSLGILFFTNKSSKAVEVDFAILLKNDSIIFLPIKFITTTVAIIPMKIKHEANRLDKPSGTPYLLRKSII